jgi:hypothetical protein
MYKQAKIVDPIDIKQTNLIVVRSTFRDYDNKWQYLTIEEKNFKSYSRDAEYRYSKYLLGGFRICLKKLK